MAEWRVYVGDTLFSRTDWPPVAVAAWERATRDTLTEGGRDEVVLRKDGREIARVLPRRDGHRWPDDATAPPVLQDVGAAIVLLARTAGIDAPNLADAMSRRGLPTARNRLDRIRSISREGRAHTTPAELIAMCYAIVGLMKNDEKGG